MGTSFRYYLLFSSLLLTVKTASAATVNYSLEAGAQYSDNIMRDETDQVTDTAGRLAATLNVTDENSVHDFELGMNLEYLNYKDDTYDDDVYANINLASVWGLVDDTVTWTVDGFFGQQSIDPFAVRTPDNIQDTGFITTGPNLVMRFTDLDSFTLGYRYNDFYAEETDADYQSNTVTASLARRTSPLLTVSLNGSYNDLDYQEPTLNDFEDTRYSVLLTGSTQTTAYNLEFGQIYIDFSDGSEIENRLRRLSLSRQLNRSNAVSILYTETVDNGAAALDPDRVTDTVTADLFVNELARISYEHDTGKLRLNLSYSYSDQDYVEQDTLDQRVRFGTFNAVYGTPLNLRYTFDYIYSYRDVHGSDRIDEENTIRVGLEKRLSRTMDLIFSIENFVRESTEQVQDIDENVYRLTFRHRENI